MAVYNDCLNAVLSAVNSLGLTGTNGVIPAAIQKLPRAEETLQPLPCICVVPAADPESVTPWSSENEVLVVYKIEVALINSNQGDLSAAQLPSELSWRESLRLALQQTIPSGCATVWRMQCRPGLVIDRAQVNLNYDLCGLTFLLHSIEAAS